MSMQLNTANAEVTENKRIKKDKKAFSKTLKGVLGIAEPVDEKSEKEAKDAKSEVKVVEAVEETADDVNEVDAGAASQDVGESASDAEQSQDEAQDAEGQNVQETDISQEQNESDAEVSDEASEDDDSPDDSMSFDDDSSEEDVTPIAFADETDNVAEHEEEDDMAAVVISREFYSNISFDMLAYDASNGRSLSPALKDWILQSVSRNEELSKALVLQQLPKVVRKNPDLAKDVCATAKSIAAEVANASIKYAVVFVDKKEGKAFTSRTEAQQYADQFSSFGCKFWDVFSYDFRTLENGKTGAKVSDETVEKYVENFPGDREALKRKLCFDLIEQIKKPAKQPQKDAKQNPEGKTQNGKAQNGKAQKSGKKNGGGANKKE